MSPLPKSAMALLVPRSVTSRTATLSLVVRSVESVHFAIGYLPCSWSDVDFVLVTRVDCVVSQWSTWSSCDCSSLTIRKTRIVTVPTSGGTLSSPGLLNLLFLTSFRRFGLPDRVGTDRSLRLHPIAHSYEYTSLLCLLFSFLALTIEARRQPGQRQFRLVYSDWRRLDPLLGVDHRRSGGVGDRGHHRHCHHSEKEGLFESRFLFLRVIGGSAPSSPCFAFPMYIFMDYFCCG